MDAQDENKTAELTPDRSGIVAVVGRANAGKSTLINTLHDEKVSIVSPVAQTTRNIIRSILTLPGGQIVFLDTPGVHQPYSDLGKRMNKSARSSVGGVDVSLLMVDASSSPNEHDIGWMKRLMFTEGALLIVLNKTDLPNTHTAEYQAAWQEVCTEKERQREVQWFELSAKNGTGLEPLLAALLKLMPVGPLLFPPDVLTDFPKKLALADIIREQYIPHLKDELPHALAVFIDEIHEDKRRWKIEATLYVNRNSQKGILIGKKGRLINKVSRAAAQEIGSIYDKEVQVRLWVKVEPNWEKNFWLLKRFGYMAQ